MSLPIEQLMQPRYMVIADYPDSLNRVGDVLEFVKDTKENWYNLRSGRTVFIMPANYPAIFRPMPWYEGRKVEEMPEYLWYKFLSDSEEKIFKVDKHFTNSWGQDNKYGFMSNGEFRSYSKSRPATSEAEYISHINKTSTK